MKADIDGLILAAGRSSRMNVNKVLATLAGKPLLDHVIDRLTPQVNQLFINGDPETCGQRANHFIADRLDGFRGPLTGLYSALASDMVSSESRPSYLMLAPCDGPFLPCNLVTELHRQVVDRDADIACIRYQGFVQPTFSLWHKRTRSAVQVALLEDGNGGFKPLLNHLNTVYLDWPEQQVNPFFNINSPADLALAERTLCP